MSSDGLQKAGERNRSGACREASNTELLSSCHLIDHILDQTPNPTWVSDSHGTLIRINPACLRLLQLSEEDVLGKYNILKDNIVIEQGFLPLLERVFDSGETARFEITYDSSRLQHLRLESSAEVVLEVTVFALKDEEGKVTNAVIQHIDITARRRAEEALERANAELETRVKARTEELTAAHRALQDSEELFRTLCAAAPIGIFMTGPAGNCIYANPRLKELTGPTPEETGEVCWASLLHPDDSRRTMSAWKAAVAAGAPFQDEFRFVVAGRTVWIRGLAHPYRSPGGEVAGYVGIVEDTTEQRQVREELLRTQKLESLGVLAGGIAHDFNNVLSIILGYISLARSRTKEEEVVERLKDSERGVQRARGLTQQLLTFARGGKPVRKVVSLNDLLVDAVNFAAAGSKVLCDFRLSPERLLLSADEGQLGQVVHNLILNASQAMPEGGTVTVESCRCDSPDGEPQVRFSIGDTGSGIPEEIRPRIFDPYFSTKKGSGLGLTSSYAIIKNHGGKIRVDSASGAGSTFTVTLPASFEKPVSKAARVAENRGSGRVLFMDDEPHIRRVGEAILTQLGYEADAVADGEEVLEAYRSAMTGGNRYAAVIMDLTVPGRMGGKDALQALLALDPFVKAIVSSGYGDDPVLADFRAYGFQGVLVKPYNKDDLGSVLYAVLAVEQDR